MIRALLLSLSFLLLAEGVLTERDVVRMLAEGSSEKEVLAAIRSHEGRYDLSDDMVGELRRAGVSERLLRAMRDATAKEERAAAPPATAVDETPNVFVRVEKGGKLRFRTPVDFDAVPEWRLRLEPDRRRIADVAVWLACTTPEHVPQAWRSLSPLGDAGVPIPRHRMLAFVAGASEERKAGERTVVVDRIEARVDPDEKHDIVLGVALLIDGRWYPAGTATIEIPEGGEKLAAKLRQIGPGGARVEVVLKREGS